MASETAYPFERGETPNAYAKRLSKRIAFENDTLFILDLSNLHNKARYGGKQIGEDERDLMKRCYNEMVRKMRDTNKRSRFMYLRYVRRFAAL